MTETTFVTALMQQAPGMGAIIVVVILFLKAIEKRDALFIAEMKGVAAELSSLRAMLTSHDQWEREVITDIQETQQNVITKKLKAVRSAK